MKSAFQFIKFKKFKNAQKINKKKAQNSAPFLVFNQLMPNYLNLQFEVPSINKNLEDPDFGLKLHNELDLFFSDTSIIFFFYSLRLEGHDVNENLFYWI